MPWAEGYWDWGWTRHSTIERVIIEKGLGMVIGGLISVGVSFIFGWGCYWCMV